MRAAPGLGRDRHPVRDSVRCPGRPNRPHDKYHQRLWQGAGFAGGRDHFWRGAQPAGVHLGISFSSRIGQSQIAQDLLQAGAFICFLFLLGGASRLARFNISHDAQPRNPGRPGRKYFVGMPIPAAAGMLAATRALLGVSVTRLVGRRSLARHGGRCAHS